MQKYSLVAQLAERMAVNHDVVGSSPTGRSAWYGRAEISSVTLLYMRSARRMILTWDCQVYRISARILHYSAGWSGAIGSATDL